MGVTSVIALTGSLVASRVRIRKGLYIPSVFLPADLRYTGFWWNLTAHMCPRSFRPDMERLKPSLWSRSTRGCLPSLLVEDTLALRIYKQNVSMHK